MTIHLLQRVSHVRGYLSFFDVVEIQENLSMLLKKMFLMEKK